MFMKKLFIILILNLYVTNILFGYEYHNSNYHNRYNSIYEQSIKEYRPIGYSTNYSNGQFNSTQYYTGTFNPTRNSNSYPNHGKPRKVVIKHGNDSIDTGLQDDWNPKWKYYHGSVLGIGFDERWYYKDGDDMYFWNGNNWEHAGRWDWVHTHEHATAQQTVPIGDSIIPIIILSLLYLFLKIKTKTHSGELV